MTTGTQRKPPCATCGKASALFMCRGCEQDFCMRHANEHRQELGKQIDELTLDYDQFREKLLEETTQVQYYAHIQRQIDQWEQESIDQIHQAARDAHKQLDELIDQRSRRLTENLSKIAHEINDARKEDEFFETDIHEWIKQLNKLKNAANKSPGFTIEQNDYTVPFISKIHIGIFDKVFDRIIGNVRLADDDRVIVHEQPDEHATIRGRGEYSSGKHRLRLKIEEFCSSKWIFIGIISRDTLMEQISIKCRSTYGWAGPNQVYVNGIYYPDLDNYESDVQKNDVLELFVNCDERRIRLTNERTQSSYELDIDLNMCPFPWQLNINMYFVGDRIRFLSP